MNHVQIVLPPPLRKRCCAKFVAICGLDILFGVWTVKCAGNIIFFCGEPMLQPDALFAI